MNLDQLDTFLAIARSGSIHRAAESLFLAQTTVTHRLRQLEQSLGQSLFVRTSQGVSLTASGHRFLPVATSVVEQLRAFTRNSPAETLTIVAGRAFASYELPRLIASYRRVCPGFQCYVRSTLFTESVSSLLTGQADLALLGSEVHHPQLSTYPLPSDEIVLVVAPGHSFAAGLATLPQFADQDVIAFGTRDAPFRQRIETYFAHHHIALRVVMELESMGAVKGMVREGLGISFLPARTVEDEVSRGELCAVPLPAAPLQRPTLLVYPSSRETDTHLQSFISWITVHW